MATIRTEHHAQAHDAGWTEDRVARLRKLWTEGQSASQIAKDLGGGVTRNAVISKVHRLGLSGPAAPSRPARATFRPARPARPTQPPSPPRPLAFDATPAVPRLAPLEMPPEPVLTEGPTLMQLGAHACKWPIGSHLPVQRFCGRRRHGEKPYCEEHVRVGYSAASSLAKHSPKELARSLRRFI